METTTIYALYKDYTPFYVGKAKNPKDRFYRHKRTFGKDIIMKELDVVYSIKKEDWKPYETAWIQIYKEWGYEIKNKNDGGGGRRAFRTEEEVKQTRYEGVKNWNTNNYNKIKSTSKQWKLDNPEKNKQFAKEWREKNPDYAKEWREKNSDYMKQWYQLKKQQNANTPT